MQVEAARRLQNAMQLDQPRRHHHQISHHLIAIDQVQQRFNRRRNLLRRIGDQVAVGRFGGFAPMPGVFEGGDLGFAVGAAFSFEEHIVIAIAVEGRVKVDEVDAGIGKVFAVAQDLQVVAVIEPVFHLLFLSNVLPHCGGGTQGGGA